MLAEQVGLKHRNKKSKAVSVARSSLGTPLSKLSQHSSSERVMAMSPAAQRLLSTKLGVRLNTDKALRQSYTPSPSSRRLSSTPGKETPTFISTPSVVTPKRHQKQSKRLSVAGDKEAALSITDNLLDLPKRPNMASESSQKDVNRKCAADFF